MLLLSPVTTSIFDDDISPFLLMTSPFLLLYQSMFNVGEGWFGVRLPFYLSLRHLKINGNGKFYWMFNLTSCGYFFSPRVFKMSTCLGVCNLPCCKLNGDFYTVFKIVLWATCPISLLNSQRGDQHIITQVVCFFYGLEIDNM